MEMSGGISSLGKQSLGIESLGIEGLGIQSLGSEGLGLQRLGPSGHVDDFARRNLPPFDQWPELLLDRPEIHYHEYFNAAVELTDRIVEQGLGDRIALIGNGRQRTYKE